MITSRAIVLVLCALCMGLGALAQAKKVEKVRCMHWTQVATSSGSSHAQRGSMLLTVSSLTCKLSGWIQQGSPG
jgi:hypothetical protein